MACNGQRFMVRHILHRIHFKEVGLTQPRRPQHLKISQLLVYCNILCRMAHTTRMGIK